MGHADHGLFDAGAAFLLHQLVEQGDEAVAALEREALLADVLGVQIALETLGRGELPEDVLLLLGTEAVLDALRLEIVLQPQPLFGVRDVREFGTDGVAVDEPQGREYVPKLDSSGDRRRAAAGNELGLHVGIRQGEILGIENVGHRARPKAQGIEVGDQMTAVRVHLDQAGHGRLLGARGSVPGLGTYGIRRASAGLQQPRRQALADPAVIRLGDRAGGQALKIASPSRLDRGRILEELFVQVLDEIGIATV